MDAKYVAWVRDQIKGHAPDPSEPDRVQALALAAYNLSIGAGTLFGMHWPETGLGELDLLRDEALQQLTGWFECLDEHDAVEVARFVKKHNLRVPIPPAIVELLRRVESREGLELPDPTAEQVSAMAQRIASAPTALKTAWLSVQAAAQSTMLALQRLEWEHDPFIVEPPASAAHLASVENELPFALPSAFVRVMGLWGRTAFFTWSVSAGDRPNLPPALHELRDGGFDFGLWDLGRVLQLRTQCEVWRDAGGHPPGSDGYLLWDRALPFAGQDGHFLTLQITEDPNDAPVVYLNNDQDTEMGHGRRLAASLPEFLLTWSELGFPGEDFTSLKPFCTPSGLSLETETAREWRAYLFREQASYADVG